MFDPVNPRLLTQRLQSLLCRHGHYVLRSADLRHWADLVESRGGWVNPSYLPELHDGPGEFLAIFAIDPAGGDRFAAAIAWRVVHSDDYVAGMRDASEWIPDAAAFGWTEWPIRDAPLIAGRVHDRGGLFVAPEFRKSRLSWYLTGLHWSIAVDDRADFVVSHTLPKVSGTKLPRAVYGYENLAIMPEHAFPWHPAPMASALVWSDAHAAREEVTRRLRCLRQCHADDLRGAAVAYERYQDSVERPHSVGATTVQERDTRPA